MPGGKEFGRVRGRFLHRRRRKLNADVEFTTPVSLPGVFENRGDVGGRPGASIVRKPEVTKRATARGSRLENVDVTFLLLRAKRLSPLKRAVMNVRSRGFGQI